jgi:hypothetical protein
MIVASPYALSLHAIAGCGLLQRKHQRRRHGARRVQRQLALVFAEVSRMWRRPEKKV